MITKPIPFKIYKTQYKINRKINVSLLKLYINLFLYRANLLFIINQLPVIVIYYVILFKKLLIIMIKVKRNRKIMEQ